MQTIVRFYCRAFPAVALHKHAYLVYFVSNCCHLRYVSELIHKVVQSGPVVLHPIICHTVLRRMHQLVPASDHLEVNEHVTEYRLKLSSHPFKSI